MGTRSHCILIEIAPPYDSWRLMGMRELDAYFESLFRYAYDAMSPVFTEGFYLVPENWRVPLPGAQSAVVLGSKEPVTFQRLFREWRDAPLREAERMLDSALYSSLKLRTAAEIGASPGVVVVDRPSAWALNPGVNRTEKTAFSGIARPGRAVNYGTLRAVWQDDAQVERVDESIARGEAFSEEGDKEHLGVTPEEILAQYHEREALLLAGGHYCFWTGFCSVPHGSAKLTRAQREEVEGSPERFALVQMQAHA